MVEGEESLSRGLCDVVGEQLHDGEHAQTAVLKLLRLQLGQLVPCEVNSFQNTSAVAEVTRLLALLWLEDGVLEETHEQEDLQPAEERNNADGGDSVGDIGEFKSLTGGKVSGDSGVLLDEVSDDGGLSHSSVLDLDRSPAGELGLVGAL